MNPEYKWNDFFCLPQSLPKVAFITGGTVRLGRGIALLLARVGFDIAVHSRRDTRNP